jgi:predicted extracellular nuclease
MSKRYIHVGTWNIEHFSKVGGRQENIYALAEHIQMGSLDVLALQEVYSTGLDNDGRMRNKDLDAVLGLIKEHTEQSWEYVILENRDASDTSQLCCVAWNSQVVTLRKSVKIPVKTQSGEMRLWDRQTHGLLFKYADKTDFVIIPLHMKSNVGGATQNKRVRHAEAQELIAQMGWLRTELQDEDIIMLGDTNCLASHEPALKTITDAGFLDLNEADTRTFVSGAPFDRVFIPASRKVFRYSRQYVMISANPDDHDRYLSDHYLCKVVLKILSDDDPNWMA